MAANRIRIVTDRPRLVLEVHPPAINIGEMASVTVDYCLRVPARW